MSHACDLFIYFIIWAQPAMDGDGWDRVKGVVWAYVAAGDLNRLTTRQVKNHLEQVGIKQRWIEFDLQRTRYNDSY
jgi:hypothetical protein